MDSPSIALVSRHIVVSDRLSTRLCHGALLISSGVIQAFIPYENVSDRQLDLAHLRSQWMVEDLGDLYVIPGLVDLNVHCGDGFEGLSKAAVAGGVTTVALDQASFSQTFCDVAPLVDARSVPGEDAFGVRLKLDGSESLEVVMSRLALYDLPVLVHVNWQNDGTPQHVLSPYRPIITPSVPNIQEFDLESSDSDSETDLSADNSPEYKKKVETPKTKDPGAVRRTSLQAPTFVKPFSISETPPTTERKRVSLPDALGFMQKPTPYSIQIKPLASLRRFTAPQVPEFSRDILEASRADYLNHLWKHPPSHEAQAIQSVLRAPVLPSRIHFCNISSATAVNIVNRGQATCDTAASFLYFSDASVKPGDTRFKSVPPIRELSNRTMLWEALGQGSINAVTSFHKTVAPALKFFGDFKTAPSGLNVLGCSLQAVWTLMRMAGCSEANLVQLSQWLSYRPAYLLGLDRFKGSIAVGKHADLVVWNPHELGEVEVQFPETCPFVGERMWGVIHRTYLRGHLVYCKRPLTPSGVILSRLSFSQ